MNVPKRIKYKGQIYEAIGLKEEYSRECCAVGDDWDWGYTQSDVERINAASDDAEQHPEDWVSLEDMAKRYGIKI